MKLGKFHRLCALVLIFAPAILGAQERTQLKRRPSRPRNIQAQQPLVDYEEYYDENGGNSENPNGSNEAVEEGVCGEKKLRKNFKKCRKVLTAYQL